MLLAGALVGSSRLGPRLFEAEQAQVVLGAVIGAALAAAALVVLWPRLRPPRRLEPLTLDGGRLRLPRSVFREGADRLDLREVLHLGVSPGKRGYLEVLTARRRYHIPLWSVRDPERLPMLGRAYQRATARLDGGREHLAEMESSHRLGAALSARPAVGTRALLFAIGVVFLLQLALGGLTGDPYARAEASLRLGASAPTLNPREPWRLVSATFLHGSLLHAYMNGLALWVLGTVLERLMGSARFLGVFLWSAAVGAALSSWASEAPYSLGASGGIFGALGGLAALHVAGREPIPPGFRQPLRWWVLIAGINIALPILFPFIDVWGHFGGAATGFVLGLVFAVLPAFRLGGPPGPFERSAASFAVALFTVGLSAAALAALGPEARHRVQLAEVLLPPPVPGELGAAEMAIRILADGRAPEHLIRAADTWLGHAAAEDEAHPAILLVLSERLEARNALASALGLRWRALEAHAPGAFPALVDGLQALEARPLALGPAGPAAVELSRLEGDDRVEMALDPPVGEAPVSVFFLHRSPGGPVVHLLEWPVHPGAEPTARAEARIPEALQASLDEGGRLEPALLAGPPLSRELTLHAVSPDARSGWRALPRVAGPGR